jgi:glycosyltransferase involved in cell wall biosynthesis
MICIAKPNEFNYSETFIDNQIKFVHHDFLIFGSWHPHLELNHGEFLSGILKYKYSKAFIKRFFPKQFQSLYTKQLSAFFKSKNIQTVLANYGVLSVNLLEACRKNNIQLFVHFHGFDASHRGTIEQFKNGYLSVFQYCNKIVSVSNYMTENLIKTGADANKIINIPYGVNLKNFSGKTVWEDNHKIYFVGRFTAKKAPDKLILAFQKILGSIPNAQLNLIGEGELFESSKLMVKQLNMDQYVIFHGKQSPEYIINELKKARLFMQHSVVAENGDSEGTPNTILEASAMGLPIVSTKHAGIKEAVVDGVTGYLVDEHDWENMANRAIELLKDLNLCQKMGNAARLHIENHYDIVNQSKKLENLIHGIN